MNKTDDERMIGSSNSNDCNLGDYVSNIEAIFALANENTFKNQNEEDVEE